MRKTKRVDGNKYQSEYYRKNRDKKLSRSKAMYWSNPELSRLKSLTAYRRNRAERIVKMREYGARIRMEVFNAYGGPICACCGEATEKFLSLDHINGGGTKHRRGVGGGGRFSYRWVRRNGYPDGFRVLCMNCNFGRAQNGGVCPHKEGENKTI